jgi:hypothetical protein
MSWQDDAVTRLNTLIERGEALWFGPSSIPGVAERANYAQYHGWRSRAMTALAELVGPDHTYAAEFTKCTNNELRPRRDAGIEILCALRSDIEDGYLKKISTLISAEVFSDFLEMAKHLCEEGYKDPAASLAGAVLENGLRRIAVNQGITVTDKDDLNSLRDKCAQKRVYNNLIRQQIVSWTTIQNSADHGQFDAYDSQQVASMISDIRAFLSNHLN